MSDLLKALETDDTFGLFLNDKSTAELRADILALVAAGGETLRDRFAMAALTGVMAQSDRAMPVTTFAKEAYLLADALLSARSKQGEGV